MPTWMFMMGLQVIIFIICAVWVLIWMNRDDDEYDEALNKLSEANLNRLKDKQ